MYRLFIFASCDTYRSQFLQYLRVLLTYGPLGLSATLTNRQTISSLVSINEDTRDHKREYIVSVYRMTISIYHVIYHVIENIVVRAC